MREYVERMSACGIPTRTAVKIYRDFRDRRRLSALRRYIEYVEGMASGAVAEI